MNTSTKFKFALAASMLTVLGVHNGSAAGQLTWDLRAVDNAASGVTVNGNKSVSVSAAATTVTFDLWAVVTGTNGTVDETFRSGYVISTIATKIFWMCNTLQSLFHLRKLRKVKTLT